MFAAHDESTKSDGSSSHIFGRAIDEKEAKDRCSALNRGVKNLKIGGRDQRRMLLHILNVSVDESNTTIILLPSWLPNWPWNVKSWKPHGARILIIWSLWVKLSQVIVIARKSILEVEIESHYLLHILFF